MHWQTSCQWHPAVAILGSKSFFVGSQAQKNMTSRRSAKIAQAGLEQVSTTIRFGLKDPRVKNVTITHVEVSPDVRTAKVYVSILGDDKQQSLCLHGLNSAKGFLQKKIADRIQTRYTPVLTFINDQGVKKSIAASQLIREALEEDARRIQSLEQPAAADSEPPPPRPEPPAGD
jgi:ribosome-binding factor A